MGLFIFVETFCVLHKARSACFAQTHPSLMKIVCVVISMERGMGTLASPWRGVWGRLRLHGEGYGDACVSMERGVGFPPLACPHKPLKGVLI